MPSSALNQWIIDRLPRLQRFGTHCASHSTQPTSAQNTIAEETLHGYVMLISGHFQGYCRDLYSESVQLCANIAPLSIQPTIQVQFLKGLAIDSGNPTVQNIRKDFERFGFRLELGKADPANVPRITDLDLLNRWRNHVAHQNATAPTQPAVLTSTDVQGWQNSCDGLAISLDDIMKQELTRILGAAPW